MADPKFQYLPWIVSISIPSRIELMIQEVANYDVEFSQAHDQPDVYETADVAVIDHSDFYEEETKNDAIERLHINTKISYNRFKGKYLTGDVDFSDRLGKKLRTGYDARSGDWELAGEGEKETPIQKCRRLQCEMQELMEEITVIQLDNSVSKEEKQSYDAVSNVVNTAKKVLESLKLEQVLGKEFSSNAPEGEVQKLLTQVEDYKKSGAGEPSTLSLNLRNVDLANSTRIAELEHRLYQLESVIGAKPDKVSRLSGFLGTNSLLEAVQQLSTKAALLQPTQLDLIEARLSNLTSKLDAIAEKSSGSIQDATREQKVQAISFLFTHFIAIIFLSYLDH